VLTRKAFLALAAKAGAGLALEPWSLAPAAADGAGAWVNDIHSKLNPTQVQSVIPVDSRAALKASILNARTGGNAVSVAGGRHAMGGQQFGAGTVHLDTRPMNRVLALDRQRGLVTVEAGIQWPELIDALAKHQQDDPAPWTIIQKQTGADRLCIGGALGANVHGRGLRFRPLIDDVESFRLIDAGGELQECSRASNRELFSLAIGGYGLFGVFSDVTLRLMPRTKLRRVVELIDVDELMRAFDERIAAGFLYGDCQFSIDPDSDGFLKRGVFSCYRPVDASVTVPPVWKRLSADDWRKLYILAHEDPKQVFDVYSSYYLGTSGQVYWSDTHQLSTYIDDYHAGVDRHLGARFPGSEMITEVYVPRPRLGDFMAALAEDFRRHEVKVIYGTIRLIEKDGDSFLPWAREPFACVVMNLHVPHSPQGISKAGDDFRRIIDRAIDRGGSYFLTYHRWASRAQVERCHPHMEKFLQLKRKYDRAELFQSDWYRHYRRMFG
jgi:FAD/FMN-containing dehydrogenase